MVRAEVSGQWGCIINTPDAEHAKQLKATDPVYKAMVAWGMIVQASGSMCMATTYPHKEQNRGALCQVEILATVPPDHRARALAEPRGTASHLSQYRSLAEADALFGPKPCVICEHDQQFTANGAVYFGRILKYLVESELWKEAFMIYLGHAQHASVFGSRVFKCKLHKILGELKLFLIQCDPGEAPEWYGTGLRAFMISQRARAIVIANIKRRAHQDVWTETFLLVILR